MESVLPLIYLKFGGSVNTYWEVANGFQAGFTGGNNALATVS